MLSFLLTHRPGMALATGYVVENSNLSFRFNIFLIVANIKRENCYFSWENLKYSVIISWVMFAKPL